MKTSSSTRHRSLRPQSRELSALDHQEPTPTCVSQPVYPGLPFTRLSAQLWCETQTTIVKTGVERSGASAHFLRLLGSGLGNTWGRNAEGTDRTRVVWDDGFRPRWEFGKPNDFEPLEWLKILALDGCHNGDILTFVQPRRFRSIKMSVTSNLDGFAFNRKTKSCKIYPRNLFWACWLLEENYPLSRGIFLEIHDKRMQF